MPSLEAIAGLHCPGSHASLLRAEPDAMILRVHLLMPGMMHDATRPSA